MAIERVELLDLRHVFHAKSEPEIDNDINLRNRQANGSSERVIQSLLIGWVKRCSRHAKLG